MTYSEEGDNIEGTHDLGFNPEEEDVMPSAYDLSEWCCNCGSAGLGPDEHAAMCSLHASWEFRNGWYVWDAPRLELVDVVQAIEDGIIPGDANHYTHSDTTIRSGNTYEENDDVRYRNWWDDDEPTEGTSAVTTTTTTYGGYTYRTKCSHYQEPFRLPSGVEVYASTYHRDRLNDPLPDLGIYMDGIWMPDCVAFHVGCPDYGVPMAPVEGVLYVAREGLRAAAEGKRVEIGCVGGHGRTGLMLAIMSLLSMREPDADKVIDDVRDFYCIEAIESREQEWYIEGIANQLRGKPWPPKPVPNEYPKYVKNEQGEWFKIMNKDAKPEPLLIPKKDTTVAEDIANKKKASNEKGSAGKPWNKVKTDANGRAYADPYYPANSYPATAKVDQATQNIKEFVATAKGHEPIIDLQKKKEEILARKNAVQEQEILLNKKKEADEESTDA